VINYLNSQDVLNFRNNFLFTTANSGNWQSVYLTVNDLSSQWAIDLDNSEVNNFVFSNSATILNVDTVVQTNSATWNYQGADIKSLTANWQNTYTNFSTQSSNNTAVYTTVNSNSANWQSAYEYVDANTYDFEVDAIPDTVPIRDSDGSIYANILRSVSPDYSWSHNIRAQQINIENDVLGTYFSIKPPELTLGNINLNWPSASGTLLLDTSATSWNSAFTTVRNNSSNWSDDSLFYPSSGGILNGSLLTNTFVSANSANLDSLLLRTIDTPTWEEGKVFYDTTNHTLAYYNDNAQMMVNVGQEQIVRVYNGTGTTITNGQVVYLNGSHGNTPQVFLANASYNNSSVEKILGIATTDIPSTGNQIGYVTVMGIVHDIDVGTNVYIEGDNVYLDTIDGGLTKTAPTKPNHIVDLGIVTGIRGGGSNNIIDVLVRVNSRNKLTELHDVIITSLSSNDILLYNPVSGGYWYNSTSNNWQNTYTNFSAQSANNLSIYTTVNSNSASNWNYQGTDVKALTANWQNTCTVYQSNSGVSSDISGRQQLALAWL
jgi:hypothetical protein